MIHVIAAHYQLALCLTAWVGLVIMGIIFNHGAHRNDPED